MAKDSKVVEWPAVGMTVEEVAASLRVDRKTVLESIKTGGLPASKIGKGWRIDYDNLKNWVANGVNISSVEDKIVNGINMNFEDAEEYQFISFEDCKETYMLESPDITSDHPLGSLILKYFPEKIDEDLPEYVDPSEYRFIGTAIYVLPFYNEKKIDEDGKIKILNGCHVSFMTIHGSAGVDISEENINNMTSEEILCVLKKSNDAPYICEEKDAIHIKNIIVCAYKNHLAVLPSGIKRLIVSDEDREEMKKLEEKYGVEGAEIIFNRYFRGWCSSNSKRARDFINKMNNK